MRIWTPEPLTCAVSGSALDGGLVRGEFQQDPPPGEVTARPEPRRQGAGRDPGLHSRPAAEPALTGPQLMSTEDREASCMPDRQGQRWNLGD